MNAKDNFQYLEHEDSNAVVSFSNQTTYKVSKLMEKINEFFTTPVLSKLPELLAESGLGTPPHYRGNCSSWSNYVDAEILKPKSGEWKKGKVRMRVILEFCPHEPELEDDSVQRIDSLDDIRQTIL